jgi:alginate O-acetyltransferase complex protein AlgI
VVFQSWSYVGFMLITLVVVRFTAAQWRWMPLLLASFFFYSLTGIAAFVLLFGSILFTYYNAQKIAESGNMTRRYRWLLVSVIGQILILGVFKYLGFFNGLMQGINAMLHRGPWQNWELLILPLGISFYTFQSMGYVFDVYYKIRKPEMHLGKYALFVSFFPQIQSGPIGRSREMMPQWSNIATPHFEDYRWAIQLFVWGLLKKFVIADRLGNYVDEVYADSGSMGTWVWMFALALYTIQLYADFSAYSDMAIASARMLGIRLSENFDFPYKAANITDFWRRWHLSLSGWLRDYIYTPLLFSKKKWKKWAVVYAIGITFVICGIWHGANMTFVWFGILQAAILIFELFTKEWRARQAERFGKLYHGLSVLLTFWVISFCFILFRAENMQQVMVVLKDLTHTDLVSFSNYIAQKNVSRILGVVALVALFLGWNERWDLRLRQANWNNRQSVMALSAMLVLLMIMGVFGKNDFIYFQF